MIEKTVYRTFVRFLKENNIYKRYIKNLENTEIAFYDLGKGKIYEHVGYNEELSDVYDWEDSIEGFEFWSDIDEKWKNVISYINPLNYNFQNYPNGILKKKL